MKLVAPERFTAEQPCTNTLHELGRQAIQTSDIDAHNNAIRSLLQGSLRMVGSFAITDCVTCSEPVKVPLHMFVIDPIV